MPTRSSRRVAASPARTATSRTPSSATRSGRRCWRRPTLDAGLLMAAQLEIILRRGYGAGYWAGLQLARSGDEGDVVTSGPLAPDFDPDKLPAMGDGVAYGLAVGDALLHDPRVRAALAQATTAAGADYLRVRLHVHPDAAALYRVAWETA